ncbi:MAG: hypothetical protein AB7S26_24805 [Sandaracinaceae bacterium]
MERSISPRVWVAMVGVPIAIVALAIGLFFLAHARSESVPPVWTAADLPTPPSPEENGAVPLAAHPVRGIPEAIGDLVNARGETSALEVYRDRRDELAREATDRGGDIQRARVLLDRPRLAMDCASFGGRCDIIGIVSAADLVALGILADPIEGRLDPALRDAAGLLERADDLARDALSHTEWRVGIRVLETAVAVAEVLSAEVLSAEVLSAEVLSGEAGAQDERERGEATLRAAVRAVMERGPPRLDSAVRAEYVELYAVCETSEGWRFARGATEMELAARYVPIERFARGEGPLPAPPPEREGWFWEFNREGQMLTSAGMLGDPETVERYVEHTQEIMTRLAEVQRRLDARELR